MVAFLVAVAGIVMGAERDALDRALARVGTPITVRRVVAGVPKDATCLANVRSFRLKDDPLRPSSEQAQDEILVILSPTGLSGWPGAGTGPSYPQRGDFVVIRGLSRVVEVADPIYIGDELVRIDIRAVG